MIYDQRTMEQLHNLIEHFERLGMSNAIKKIELNEKAFFQLWMELDVLRKPHQTSTVYNPKTEHIECYELTLNHLGSSLTVTRGQNNGSSN